MALAKAIERVDEMITSLENQLGVNPWHVDPEDIWALHDLKKSKNCFKVPCQTPGCNYRMMKPFEHRCPSCFSKVPANLRPAFELKPLPPPPSKSGDEAKKEEPKQPQKAAEKPKEKAEEKAVEKAAPAAATAASTQASPAEVATNDEFAQALLQVSQIVEVNRHPDADTLYVCKVKVSQGEVRTLVSGIVAHYKAEELQDRFIVTILNLKPAKLRGIASEAMLLAGTDPASGKVCLVTPPEGSAIGDRVFLKGGQPSSNPAKTLSSKVWQKVVPSLKSRVGLAHFNNSVMATLRGDLTVPGCGDEGGIH